MKLERLPVLLACFIACAMMGCGGSKYSVAVPEGFPFKLSHTDVQYMDMVTMNLKQAVVRLKLRDGTTRVSEPVPVKEFHKAKFHKLVEEFRATIKEPVIVDVAEVDFFDSLGNMIRATKDVEGFRSKVGKYLYFRAPGATNVQTDWALDEHFKLMNTNTTNTLVRVDMEAFSKNIGSKDLGSFSVLTPNFKATYSLKTGYITSSSNL